jgi:hypothetical protein
MTQVQIGKVWLVVGAILLYYAINSWIVAQGGNEVFGAKLVVSNKVPAAMLAIPICSVLLILVSLIGRLFASRGSSLWHERIPIVGFEAIETGSQEGKIYQGAIIVIFSLIPAAALIYFWRSFLGATVMLNDKSKATINVWDWSPTLKTLDDPARICTDFNKDLPDPCVGSGTVLPGLEPMVFAILTLVSLVALAMYWRAVFFSKRHLPQE